MRHGEEPADGKKVGAGVHEYEEEYPGGVQARQLGVVRHDAVQQDWHLLHWNTQTDRPLAPHTQKPSCKLHKENLFPKNFCENFIWHLYLLHLLPKLVEKTDFIQIIALTSLNTTGIGGTEYNKLVS